MISIKRSGNGSFDVAELLESGKLAPRVDGEGPYWQPPVPRALRDVIQCALVPDLSWAGTNAEGDSMTDIEENAPLLAAANGATFAHGKLEHSGRHDPAAHHIHPGFYLVDVRRWPLDNAPGNPLGGNWSAPHAWVDHHVYALLRDLQQGARWTPGGQWSGLMAYDSWTCKTACRLTDWTLMLRNLRADMISSENVQGQAALEYGFVEAIGRWNIPAEQDGAGRADWHTSVHSYAFATAWRRAWAAAHARRVPVTAGGDGTYHGPYGMSFKTHDLTALLRVDGSPIRLDETGTTLGTYRRTRTYTAQQSSATVRQNLTEEFDQ